MFHTDDEASKNPWPDGMPVRKQFAYGILGVLCVLGALCGLSALSGCGQTPEQRSKFVQELIDANNRVKAGVVATTQQAPAIEAQLQALPPSKARDEALADLAKGKAYAASAQKISDDAGRILAAAQGGDGAGAIAATAGALSGVPGVGPYAGLIGVVLAGAYSVYQTTKKNQALAVAADANAEAQANLNAANEAQGHLKNVVFSIEHGGPEWTADHASEIAALQGPATTAAVNAIKQEIGIAYAHPVENVSEK
jgi:hypothetical protein